MVNIPWLAVIKPSQPVRRILFDCLVITTVCHTIVLLDQYGQAFPHVHVDQRLVLCGTSLWFAGKRSFYEEKWFLNISEFAFSHYVNHSNLTGNKKNNNKQKSPWQGTSAAGPLLSSTDFDFNLILTILGLNMWIYPMDVGHLGWIHQDFGSEWARVWNWGLAAGRCQGMLLPLGGLANKFCYMDGTLRCKHQRQEFLMFFFLDCIFFFFAWCWIVARKTVIWNCNQEMNFSVALYLRCWVPASSRSKLWQSFISSSRTCCRGWRLSSDVVWWSMCSSGYRLRLSCP